MSADRDPLEQLRRELLAERFQRHPEHIPTTEERTAHAAMQDILTAADRRPQLRVVRGGAA